MRISLTRASQESWRGFLSYWKRDAELSAFLKIAALVFLSWNIVPLAFTPQVVFEKIASQSLLVYLAGLKIVHWHYLPLSAFVLCNALLVFLFLSLWFECALTIKLHKIPGVHRGKAATNLVAALFLSVAGLVFFWLTLFLFYLLIYISLGWALSTLPSPITALMGTGLLSLLWWFLYILYFLEMGLPYYLAGNSLKRSVNRANRLFWENAFLVGFVYFLRILFVIIFLGAFHLLLSLVTQQSWGVLVRHFMPVHSLGWALADLLQAVAVVFLSLVLFAPFSGPFYIWQRYFMAALVKFGHLGPLCEPPEPPDTELWPTDDEEALEPDDAPEITTDDVETDTERVEDEVQE